MLIESFHCGQRGQRIYCSLHRPTTRLVRSTGVVLCNPLGHEYYRAYRSYVKLADQLAQLGFPVMRFDYLGTGDSDGERSHERLDEWLHEVATVVEQLKQSEPVSSIALGGLRFGATLSMLAAQRLDNVQALLLWDPLVHGERYVEELHALHDNMLHDLERFPHPRSADHCSDGELLGTLYAPLFLRELAALRYDTLTEIHNCEILVVNSREQAADDSWPDGKDRRRAITAARTSRDYGWTDVHRVGESIMDPDAIRHFTSAMGATAA